MHAWPDQLPPVFDTELYSDAHRNANSNYGKQIFDTLDDVIMLKTIVRQDESELELRALNANMRHGYASGDYTQEVNIHSPDCC